MPITGPSAQNFRNMVDFAKVDGEVSKAEISTALQQLEAAPDLTAAQKLELAQEVLGDRGALGFGVEDALSNFISAQGASAPAGSVNPMMALIGNKLDKAAGGIQGADAEVRSLMMNAKGGGVQAADLESVQAALTSALDTVKDVSGEVQTLAKDGTISPADASAIGADLYSVKLNLRDQTQELSNLMADYGGKGGGVIPGDARSLLGDLSRNIGTADKVLGQVTDRIDELNTPAAVTDAVNDAISTGKGGGISPPDRRTMDDMLGG